jgi:hypothetical protein
MIVPKIEKTLYYAKYNKLIVHDHQLTAQSTAVESIRLFINNLIPTDVSIISRQKKTFSHFLLYIFYS